MVPPIGRCRNYTIDNTTTHWLVPSKGNVDISGTRTWHSKDLTVCHCGQITPVVLAENRSTSCSVATERSPVTAGGNGRNFKYPRSPAFRTHGSLLFQSCLCHFLREHSQEPKHIILPVNKYVAWQSHSLVANRIGPGREERSI